MEKKSSAILILIILLSVECVICSLGKNATFGCVVRERKALLKFKASLVDLSNVLSSWNSKDCCTWVGVSCNKSSGHVTRLDLRNARFNTNSTANVLQGSILDSSLLELKHLSWLDLSGNDFQLSPIPKFLGSMKQLQHLNLSSAGFSGIVPHNLGNLSSLRVLDLSHGYSLIINKFMWASRLSSLEYLDLSYADLSGAIDLGETLHLLPSLVVLRLSRCLLVATQLPLTSVNSTLNNVQYLDLSLNSFHGEFPQFLQNMTSLRVLDLSDQYISSVTHLLRLRKLVLLNLAFNSIHYKADWISEFSQNKCHLKSLNLKSNRFYGEISRPFKNSSGCWNHKLERLSLAMNDFFGHLPEELGEFKHLKYLDLSYNANISGLIPTSLWNLSALTELDLSSNKLSGPIPSTLGNLRALKVLHLNDNHLTGEVPISLGQLLSLEAIDISFNSFNGTLSEAHFAKLSRIEYIETRFNFFKFRVGFDWAPSFQLKYLSMQSCNFGGQFPQWLQTQRELTEVHLSNCSISGTLPKWLHYINLTTLDLSHNMIFGHLPSNIGQPVLMILNLAKNFINGSLPDSLCEMKALRTLDLSNNHLSGSIPDSLCEMKALQTLDLSNNHLSGNLPDCWANFQELNFLILSSNEISGIIPNSFGGAYSLEWLHLNNNRLMGKLPSTLRNCSKLQVLDVGDNKLSGKLPKWIGEYLLDLKVLRLRNSEFYGAIPSEFCGPVLLQIMDLANNKLTGNIPHCFGNFIGMVKKLESDSEFAEAYDANWFEQSLNEVMKGLVLEYTKTLVYVVNLDLSNNNLVGEIPTELTSLSALIGLNLSHNHLTGKIPGNIGDLKSLESLDLSSNNLSGTIPNNLSILSSLSHLNLSHNNLSGKIPTGHQLQTLDDPSNYEGNPQLCGAPLAKKCHGDEVSQAPNLENHIAADEGNKADKIVFCAVIASGFATGFWGVIGVLIFKRSWRQAYFQFIEGRIGSMLG